MINMGLADSKELRYMLIVERVIYFLALPSALDYAELTHLAQLMGYRGFGHRQNIGKIAHAHLVKHQRKQNLQTGAVADYLVEIRKPEKYLVLGYFPESSFYQFVIYSVAVTFEVVS